MSTHDRAIVDSFVIGAGPARLPLGYCCAGTPGEVARNQVRERAC